MKLETKMTDIKPKLEIFKDYLGKEINIKNHSEGCDWERCRWESNSSTEFVLDGLLEREGCVYLTGHNESTLYVMASKYEMKNKEQESIEQGEITTIIESGKDTGLASILKGISKPHIGPNITAYKWKRNPDGTNTFLTTSFLEKYGMKILIPKRSSAVMEQITTG